MWNRIIMSLLPLIVTSVTPAIKDGADALLVDLRAKAEATPNPFDDAFVDILETLLK